MSKGQGKGKGNNGKIDLGMTHVYYDPETGELEVEKARLRTVEGGRHLYDPDADIGDAGADKIELARRRSHLPGRKDLDGQAAVRFLRQFIAPACQFFVEGVIGGQEVRRFEFYGLGLCKGWRAESRQYAGKRNCERQLQ